MILVVYMMAKLANKCIEITFFSREKKTSFTIIHFCNTIGWMTEEKSNLSRYNTTAV